ncbi:MAG: hypothetical protein V1716_00915 [Candidatus Uhrbacteria bacterium]
MWREWTFHQPAESEFFDVAMNRIVIDGDLVKKADEVLVDFRGKAAEVVLSCPQSADSQAEGAEVRDHLRLMLQTVFAVLDEKLHVGDIEELRRLKGFKGELDEIEEIIKEKVASLEVFILAHDLGKPEVVIFNARDDSSKHHDSLSVAWQHGDRADSIKKYQKIFRDFAKKNSDLSAQEIHHQFFIENQISINYHSYAKQIAHPDRREILNKLAAEHRLTPEDAEDIFHAILLHEHALDSFGREANVAIYNYLMDYCTKHGRDADDFLDLFLAIMFIESCASPRFGVKGIYFDLSAVINFLTAEREFAPWKNEERLKRRKDKKLKIERVHLRAAGLDGDSLMKLLGMKPSPAFGGLLAQIHAFARGEGFLPALPVKISEEICRRVDRLPPPQAPSPGAGRGSEDRVGLV